MIVLRNIKKYYKFGGISILVLRNVSISIERGEFVAIMGPSGSGKSTLLNILGCLDVPDEGDYLLEGTSIATDTEENLAEIRNRRLGFVFQQFNLIPRINAIRNVELPLVYAAIAPDIRNTRAQSVLTAVGLADRAEHSPAQLSGGQQQRVAIARALVNNPDILIADEPTGSLDTQSGREIMQIFCDLNKKSMTIIMVTHEEEIAAYASRILRLRDGEIDQEESAYGQK